MDILAKVGTVVFDKTGTLTHGQFAVEAVHPERYDAHHLLHLAAHVEHYSTHPIGAALRDAFPEEATDGCHISDVEEIAGQGIRAKVGDNIVCVGNTKMMDTIGAQWHDCPQCEHQHQAASGTIIHMAIDGQYAGHIVINDKIKADSKEAIAQLKQLGVGKTVMLTGDREEVGHHVAEQLQLDEYHAGLLPADKVSHIERLLTPPETVNGGNSDKPIVAFVGDGINDAPVLARADVGIAMGGLGSDAAIEAADVVLMDDQPSKVATAIRIARKTIAIARQNVIFAIAIKVSVLLLATFGLANMALAVFHEGFTHISVKPLLVLGTRLSDHQFLRHDFLVDLRVATDVLEQQLARLNTHIIRLILDDRQFGRYVFRVNIIGKTYQRHVFWNLQPLLLDGSKGSKRDDIVESQDSIRPIIHLQQLRGSLKSPFVVNLLTYHQLTLNRNAILLQGLQIAMLTTLHHVQMIRTSHEGYPPATCVNQVLCRFLSCHITIGHHTRELLWQTGTPEKDQRDTHVRDFLKMTVISGILSQTGDDSLHMQTDEIVDGPHLSLTVLMGVRTDNRIARLARLLLDTVKHC